MHKHLAYSKANDYIANITFIFLFKNEVLLYSNRLTLNSFYNFTARTIRTFLIDFDISNSLMSKYKFNSNKLKSNKLDDFLRLVSDSRTSSYVLIFLN